MKDMPEEIENDEDVAASQEEAEETVDPIDGVKAEPASGSADADDVDDDEIIVTIGDEAPADAAEETPVIRDIRKKLREAEKRAKAAERMLSEKQSGGDLPALREKPTPLGDYYSDEDFATDLEKWFAEKAAHDQAAREQTETRKKADEQWAQKVQTYTAKKAALKVKDYNDAESAVIDALPEVHQSILVAHSQDPALLVYAIGKNESKLAELSKITNPVEFGYEIGRLESQLKVTNRKPKSSPESKVSASGGAPAISSRKLDALKEKAQETGDYTEYLAAKRAASK